MGPVIALLVALSSVAVGDAAEASGVTVRLTVAGAAGCLSRPELAARIATRSTRIRLSDDAAVAATATVISRRAGAVTAQLTLVAPGMAGPPRHVTAASCEEVADALALILVVSLDPTPPAAPPKESPRVPAKETSASNVAVTKATAADDTRRAPNTGEPPATPKPAPPAVAAPVAAEVPPPEPRVPTTPPGDQAKQRPPLQLGGAIVGQGYVGPAPNAMLGVAVYGLVASQGAGAWSPSVIVGGTHVGRSWFTPDGTASFALDAASVDACPLRWRWSWLWVRPCATLLLGRLAASGSDTLQPASVARPFGAAGGALTAGFGHAVQLWARVGAGVTLLKDAYQFGEVIFHHSDDLTISASLGIGAERP